MLSRDFTFKASFKLLSDTFQVEFHDEDWLCPHVFVIQPVIVELSGWLFELAVFPLLVCNLYFVYH